LYSGIPYGEYLDTPQCRVSIDNVRMKFSYKYKNYDFEKHEAISTIDLYSQKLDRLFYDRCEVKWHSCDFFKIGIPFTLSAIVPAYILIWILFGA
jgi:hypothetical protein